MGTTGTQYIHFYTKNAIDRIKGDKRCELPIESRKLLPPISDVCYKERKQYPEVIHIPENTENEEDSLPYTKLDTKALAYALYVISISPVIYGKSENGVL